MYYIQIELDCPVKQILKMSLHAEFIFLPWKSHHLTKVRGARWEDNPVGLDSLPQPGLTTA